MTGEELIARLAAECEQTEDIVGDLLQALADTVEAQLLAESGVIVPGLGTFYIQRPSRPTRSILVTWTSDTGMRTRVTAALNARAGRHPIAQGQAHRPERSRGVVK